MTSSYSLPNVLAATPSLTPPQPSIVSVRGQLDVILINAFWLGALVPISIALILTSSHLWKKPVFILNACAIACAFGFGGTTLTNAKDALLGHPTSRSRIQALVILSYFIPICTQSILLIRILAVYPPRLLSWKKNFFVYGVLGVVLMARIVNMGFFLRQIFADLQKSVNMFVGWTTPLVRVDWFLQLFYVTYASTLFLLRLREGSTLTLRGRIGTSIPYSNSQLRSKYVDRLRALFWIAVFNFIFPAILSVIAIIVIFSSTDSWVLTDLVTTNLYLDVVCVLLATIWCSGKYWEPHESGPRYQYALDRIEFKASVVESQDSATVAIAMPSHSRLASESQCSHSNVVFTGEGVPGKQVSGPNV